MLRFFVFPQKISRPRRCSSFFPKNPLIFWEPCHETGTSVSFFNMFSLIGLLFAPPPIFCVSTKNQSPAPLLLLFPKNPLIFREPGHETDTSVSFLICLSTSDCSSLHPNFCVSTKNPLIFWEPCHETGTSVSFFNMFSLIGLLFAPPPIFCVSTKNHSYVLSPHKHLSFMGQYYSLSGIFPFSFHPLDKFYFTTKMLYAGSITMTTPI